MANIEKYSDMRVIGTLCKHFERTTKKYSNEDIDIKRTEYNYNLAPDRDKQIEYIKQKVKELEDLNGRKLRRDAVKMVSCIVQAPKNLNKDEYKRFFELTYKFLVERYGKMSGLGENIVISAYCHMDETTPHLHFAMLPIIEKNGVLTFCAKEMINRNDLQTLHSELGTFLENNGVCKKSDILNGKTIKNSQGKAKSVKVLKKEKYLRERDGRWNKTIDKTTLNIEKGSRWDD